MIHVRQARGVLGTNSALSQWSACDDRIGKRGVRTRLRLGPQLHHHRAEFTFAQPQRPELAGLDSRVSSGSDITSQGGLSSSQLSINGSRTLNSEFLIDGVSVVTGSTGGPQTLPPAESIREFKVLTSSYSAEYGRTSGAIVTLSTNAGTNDYHGAAYGYFRNEVLDANNHFNNVLGKRRSEDRYNLFGGKIGGPLSIPKLYHGNNKTFFFINYEGLLQATPYNIISTIPSGPYAAGNFRHHQHPSTIQPARPALPGSPLENQVGPSETTGYECSGATPTRFERRSTTTIRRSRTPANRWGTI